MFKYCLIIVVLLFIAPLAAAPSEDKKESVESIYLSASENFIKGAYDKAQEKYSKLVGLGVEDPLIFYNLGTTQARMGELGYAVWNLEKTIKMEPGHADALYNLRVIREHIARRASERGRNADLFPPVSAFRAILDHFTISRAAWAFIIFYTVFFSLIIFKKLVLNKKTILTFNIVVVVLGLLCVIMLGITTGKWYQKTYISEGIVLSSDRLKVVEGPGSLIERFSLEEGERIKIIGEKSRWYKVMDSKGANGWVLKSHLGKI